MLVFRSLSAYEPAKFTVATIGTFDGLHNGHRKILEQVVAAAEKDKGESLLISFDPHPRLVLFPDDNPMRLLQTVEEKIFHLERTGLHRLLLIPFTREFSRLSSARFIEEVLVNVVRAKQIVIGYDHHFGKGREGGLTDLRDGGEKFGFEVVEIPAVAIDDAKISSTKIRNALLAGDLSTASEFLGYNYSLSGTVIEGKKLGRTLGFPTANIRSGDPLKLIPANGVYFVEVETGERKFMGMMNIGFRPTTGGSTRTIEVHLFGFEGDLYGKQVTVGFVRRLREEIQFPSVEELVKQLQKDRDACAKLMNENQ